MAELTTRERNSRKRRDADALDSANSLLVHDIKNLSFRIGSLLQNLENNYEDPLFKKSVVEILTDTVDRMDEIVLRCRQRRGDIIIKFPVDLNEILNGIVNQLPRNYQRKVSIEEKYVRIPMIWGDPEYLRDAFRILIDNAIEAMEEGGGRLILSTSTSVTPKGKSKVIVKVTDTGCGISPDFLRNGLFSPFMSTKAKGLGLGLYTCRKIVSLHEGRVHVSSREGRGSTFRVSFFAAD